ncbi:MAG: acetyl-CoA C-acyltransferase [Thermodesulfobacteriota bacterium]|nr:acetyl-CoA C-acyltransferase [Thermodesulfobacteriota bacterium]
MDLKDIVAVSAYRSPMGLFGGTLKDLSVHDLGSQVIKKTLERINLKPDMVDMTVFGNCRQAGNGVNPARTTAELAGIPKDRFAQTINCACPTGIKATIIASQDIRLGDAEIVVTGGMEHMSSIPHMIKGHRWNGFRLGNVTIMDGWYDTFDRIANCYMGNTAENVAEKYNISREDQDNFAFNSHQKASKSDKAGLFKEEIVPIDIPATKKKEGFIFSEDECIRHDANLEKMAKLKPAFREGGTVTAGNACGMPDGSAAIVLMTREKAKSLGLKPLFSIVSYSNAAVDNAYMGIGPTASIPIALERAGLTKDDIHAYEINEAFAATSLACERILGLDPEKVNINGGAISLGHPTGCSGARLIVTLYHLLKQQDKELGSASLCGGGGVSCAIIIKREN